MRAAIVVMLKAPRAGRVKTRLSPPLAAEDAAELAACFIEDTLRQALRSTGQVIIAYDPPDGFPELQAYAPAGVQWLVQEGGDLGRRQDAAITCAAVQGFGPIALVGTDSPTLPARHVASALTSLEQSAADLVLGPTRDGGYYLLGVRRPVSGLFGGVAWSAGGVCRQVEQNAAALGLRVELLPPWYDVDTSEDLRRLWEELCRSPEARAQASATYHWLQARSAGDPLFR
jgi:uncharacterized protein